jgi:hypothetical protein
LCFSKGVIFKKAKNNSLLVEGPGFVFISVPDFV